MRGPANSPEEGEKLARLQVAFDLPFAWVFTSGGGLGSNAPTAVGAAIRKRVVSVMVEQGGGGGVTLDILHQTERGLCRVLHALEMLPDYQPDPIGGTREVNVCGSIYAYDNGLLEPLKDIGDDVSENELVALIHHPDTPWQQADELRSPYTGMVLCKRALGQFERSDAMFQIAKDVEV